MPSTAAAMPALMTAVPEPTPDATAPQPRAAAIDVPWKTSIAVAGPRPRTHPGSTLWMTEKTVANAAICPAPLSAAPTMSIARFVAVPTRTSPSPRTQAPRRTNRSDAEDGANAGENGGGADRGDAVHRRSDVGQQAGKPKAAVNGITQWRPRGNGVRGPVALVSDIRPSDRGVTERT